MCRVIDANVQTIVSVLVSCAILLIALVNASSAIDAFVLWLLLLNTFGRFIL